MSYQNKGYSTLLEYLQNEDEKRIKKTQFEIRESASRETKSLIEECTISNKSDNSKIINDFKELKKSSDNPLNPLKPFSKGFDVDKLESLMRMKLVEEHKKLQSYERPYISVTELFSCLRKSYYNRLKYVVDLNSQYSFSYLYLINKIGSEIHDVIQQLYDFTDIEKTIISEKYHVKGRIDATKENCLVEIKTIDDTKFKYKYIDDHYHQGLVYAYILNTEYGYSIDTITIVYILRNLKKIVPFDTEYNVELSKKFLSFGPLLYNSILKKKVPEPINATAEQCKYCNYKKYCRNDVTEIKRPYEFKDRKKSVFLLS